MDLTVGIGPFAFEILHDLVAVGYNLDWIINSSVIERNLQQHRVIGVIVRY